ncbi:hypothetical protein OBV_34150 [Oscillibacter valericigenes Sjm18-20]|nr:hypothetical protein OBV_34150 [Oscillibacter valericigenes Sjm18-20]
MYCRKCGKEIKAGSKFCPYCGTAVQRAVPASKPQENPAVQQPVQQFKPLDQDETVLLQPDKPVEQYVQEPAESAMQLPVQQPVAQSARKTIMPPPPVGGPGRPSSPSPEKPKKKRPVLPVILCVLILLLAAGTAAAYFTGSLDGLLNREETTQSEREDENCVTSEKAEPDEEQDQESVAAASSEPVEHSAGSAAVKETPESTQEIQVVCSGSTAELTLRNWESGNWADVLNCQADIGSNGISTKKAEGDHCTPAGTYHLLFGFGTASASFSIPYTQIYEGDVWVCDPASAYYNTLQSDAAPYKDWTAAENMYKKFTGNKSIACICFDFNGDCETGETAVANGGSALFIDGVGVNGDMTSGYGDIKISAMDMTKLLQKLDITQNPTITIS